MRTFQVFVCIFFVLSLCSVCCAEKTWSPPGSKGVTFKTGDDFEAVKTEQPDGVAQELFSKKKNAQVILTLPGVKAPKDSTKAPVVTRADFIKAFPVLSVEKKMNVHAGPIKLEAGGSQAVVYEVESEESKDFQTVYAYVGRGTKPYGVILNYPSPRNPDMVKLMKQILASVKHK